MGAPFRPHCLSIDLRRLRLRPQSKPCVCGGGESGSDPLYPKAVYIQLILLLLVAVPEIKSEPEPSPALTALALLGTGALPVAAMNQRATEARERETRAA